MSNLSSKSPNVRKMTMIAMLSAVAFILMFLEISVPLMPGFIKMDFSELPALIGAFSMGPACGGIIVIIKNLLHLLVTNTGGVGELSNCLLGLCFVIPAGILYARKKTRKRALAGSVIGAVLMAVLSVPLNFFLVYPIYTAFMPMEAILGLYQAILPSADSLWKCLVIFNMPFTFLKGMIGVLITFFIYKHISPIIKGKNHK
ncbi:MAG: ECF transporter S component [Lachnospiraceae bacterium]